MLVIALAQFSCSLCTSDSVTASEENARETMHAFFAKVILLALQNRIGSGLSIAIALYSCNWPDTKTQCNEILRAATAVAHTLASVKLLYFYWLPCEEVTSGYFVFSFDWLSIRGYFVIFLLIGCRMQQLCTVIFRCFLPKRQYYS